MAVTCKKAGILIVGEEILKGQRKDSSAYFACKSLFGCGVKVERIVVVPNNVEAIAEEVCTLSKRYDLVVTSGGVGPTHCDVTYEGVARGLGVALSLNPEMAEFVLAAFGGESFDVKDNPAMKMALLPATSKLIQIPLNHDCMKTFPIVQVSNVYVHPGMKQRFKLSLSHLEEEMVNPDVTFYTMSLLIDAAELKMVCDLNDAVVKFKDIVNFTSHPLVKINGDDQTQITLESTDLDHVTNAYKYIKAQIPADLLSPLGDADHKKVYRLRYGHSSLAKSVSQAIKVIEEGFKKYNDAETLVCFNGGKDCTVLLHLVWAVRRKLGMTSSYNVLCVNSENPFEEMESFTNSTAQLYDVSLLAISGPLKEQFASLCNKRTVTAVFMGTRRPDPRSQNMVAFQMCDSGWPEVMRINPLLDWTYDDIWTFLRLLAVPYCSLYDLGYTSIGTKADTKPNEALLVKDPVTKKVKYLPAYCLKDQSLERQGRN